jgi:hypothetical protein
LVSVKTSSHYKIYKHLLQKKLPEFLKPLTQTKPQMTQHILKLS